MNQIRTLTLTRHFWWLSLVLVLLAGGTLGFFVQRLQVAQLEQMAQERNQGMTQVLRKLLADDLDALLKSPLAKGQARALHAPAVAALQSKLSTVMHDSDVVKLKLYNLQGITVFSTDPRQIGEDKRANAGYQLARNGGVASELTHRDQFSSFEGERSNVDLLSSYVPIRENGQTVAVFELYQDVSTFMQRMTRELWQLGGMLFAVLGTLYALLLLIVRRAQRAQQAQEALLHASNRALDLRVAERTQELSLSEARFRSLTEMSSDFYWESDAQHRFTARTASKREACDAVFQQLTFIGQLHWEVPHIWPDAAGWQAHRDRLDASLPFRDFEIARLGSQGLVHHVSVSGDPVFDGQGKFVGYQGVGTDTTERKQAEAELRIAATAFESQEAMMVTDAQSRILRVNQMFEEVTGYSAAEVVGQTPRVLQSGRHSAEFYRAMWDCVTRTGRWQGEVWDRRKGGGVYPKWLTISAVKNDDGVVTHYIGTHFDISERKKAEERITELAFFDPLTHLPNRTLLQDRLNQAIATSQRDGSCGAALFIDLDHFKTLNDTLGHDKGDALLQQVAQRLLDCVRASDTVARLGGDEFVLILGNLPDNMQDAANQIELLGQKVLAALTQTYHLGPIGHHITASIGATLFCGHQTRLDEVLKQADLAMYQSKEKGRNTLSFFDPSMQTLMLNRSALEQDLRSALAENQFVLHYQALLDSDHRVAGAEALIRWMHPERGMVSPTEFIPVAEDTGLILPIGHWVLETACCQLARWAAQPSMAHLTIAVNVSARQFHQVNFTQQVLAVLAHTGAKPERLKLELTESLLINNLDDVIAKMNTLKAVGISFALDDFGTGYSSLSSLSRLPLDQVKIDRSFVMNIESDENAVAISAAIISLAHSLKLKVVAEGVETNAQRYFLSTVHRCDFLQGYLISRPLSLENFEAFATRS
jgi:diguanylate cyclase (GGDEF)-like protein/PAS domain S-box-containing protein